MENVVVVEPHADDAFLSLGGHITAWIKAGVLVTIVTVFSGTRKRARDAQAYADAVGAQWVGLGAREGDDGGGAAEGMRCLRAGLPEVLKPLDPRATRVIGPLGIKHPDHLAVVQALLVTGKKRWAYADQPYTATQSNGEEVNAALAGARIVSYLKPHLRKYRHAPLFRDQAKFFYFNPPTKLAGNIELIVEV